MKITEFQKKVLWFLASAAVVAIAVFLVIMPCNNERKTLEATNQTLQAKFNDLQAKERDRATYESGITEYQNMIDNILADFPTNLDQEVSVMFIDSCVNDDIDKEFDIESVGFGRDAELYQLGDISVTGADSTTDTASTEDSTEETTEAASEDGTTLVEEGTTVDSSAMVAYSVEYPISYVGSYKGIKNFIDYVEGYAQRMTVNEMSITYDYESRVYSGSVVVRAYAVYGGGRPTSNNIELDDVEIGVDNIFTSGGNGANNVSSKYDEDDGAAIANDYDLYMMLNPSTSDVSAKVMGINKQDSTAIKSATNEVEAAKITITEESGKYYAEYNIGGVTSDKVAFDPGEDMNLLIQSNARVGSDDMSGVKLSIVNETSKMLNVKVINDDATSPRFKVASRKGSIKVY